MDNGARLRRNVKERLKSARGASELVALYPASYVQGRRNAEQFRDLKVFCLFLGYPRSGGSLVGALLDAHPQMMVAQEVDILRFVDAHFTRTQLYHLIRSNSRAQASKGRRWTGYSYAVPNQWQGRFEHLQVIGDKKAGGSTKRLRAKPELVDRLQDTVGIPVNIIHVTRNPYDNISTIARRRRIELGKAIDAYFSLCKTASTVIERLRADQVTHVRHEALIDNPQECLRDVCGFLGVSASDDYLRDCASIVFKSPHKSRQDAPWCRKRIDRVAGEMSRYPHLAKYAFDE